MRFFDSRARGDQMSNMSLTLPDRSAEAKYSVVPSNESAIVGFMP